MIKDFEVWKSLAKFVLSKHITVMENKIEVAVEKYKSELTKILSELNSLKNLPELVTEFEKDNFYVLYSRKTIKLVKLISEPNEGTLKFEYAGDKNITTYYIKRKEQDFFMTGAVNKLEHTILEKVYFFKNVTEGWQFDHINKVIRQAQNLGLTL